VIKWIIEVAALNNQQIIQLSTLIKNVVISNFKEDVYTVEVESFYKTIKNRMDYIDGANLIANEAIEQVILNGECVNDTITEEVLKDTIIYKDTVIHDSFKVNMPMECHLDTIVNDFSVYLENGNLWVKWLGQIPTRTINKQTTHVVVDRAKEAILIDSCKALELKIYDKENQLARKNKTLFKLYLGLAFLILFMLRKPILKLIGI
jgi:hypothetical protein